MSDKFIQPADAVHIVSRSGKGTLLSDETIAAGRARIAAGEDPAAVSLELAMLEISLIADWCGEDV